MSSPQTDIRDAFFDRIYDIAAADPNFIFLTADQGAFSLTRFRKDFPKQYVNVGAAEQNLIGVAAGLALAGKRVCVYGIASFVTQRCYEQIKIDLAAMNLPVTIVSVGGGFTYDSDGPTHHATQDIAALRALPNFQLFSPGDPVSAAAVASQAYESKKPAYVRLDKGRLPDYHEVTDNFQVGLKCLKQGREVAIVSTGIIVGKAFELASTLSSHGIDTAIYDIYRLKPLNEDLLVSELNRFSQVVSLEEHSVIGGLGSALAECFADHQVKSALLRFALADAFPSRHGKRDWLQDQSGLKIDLMVEKIIKFRNSEKKLELTDVSELLGVSVDELNPTCREIVQTADFSYRELNRTETDRLYSTILKQVDRSEFTKSGEKDRWDKGWGENWSEYEKSQDLSALVPKYVRADRPIRFKGRYILPRSPRFELDWYTLFRNWFFTSHLGEVDAIYEFGCGSAYNLPILAALFPRAEIHGLDWAEASKKIIDKMGRDTQLKVKGHVFDMFAPDENLEVRPNSGFLTLGAFEQLGDNYETFLNYLLQKRPRISIHMEPLRELYDPTLFFDDIALRYHDERKYLGNLLQTLRRLEKDKKIEIQKVQRVHLGSTYHEGYSFVVWRPLEPLS